MPALLLNVQLFARHYTSKDRDHHRCRKGHPKKIKRRHLMKNKWEERTKQVVEQGKRENAGLIDGGELVIDANPEKGFLRIELRDIKPSETVLQIITGFSWLLTNGAAMLNLHVKRHVERKRGDNHG